MKNATEEDAKKTLWMAMEIAAILLPETPGQACAAFALAQRIVEDRRPGFKFLSNTFLKEVA